jgi:hypothetical protein
MTAEREIDDGGNRKRAYRRWCFPILLQSILLTLSDDIHEYFVNISFPYFFETPLWFGALKTFLYNKWL